MHKTKKEEINYLRVRIEQTCRGDIDVSDTLFSVWIQRMLFLNPEFKIHEGYYYKSVDL